MTTKEMTELQWLVARLRDVATQLERAHKILTAATAAEKLIDQVKAIATPGATSVTVNSEAVPAKCRLKTPAESSGFRSDHSAAGDGSQVAGDRQRPLVGRLQPTASLAVRLESVETTVGASRVGAVFDAVPLTTEKFAKKCGGQRPPF
jgi:plasmid replication initiation protein